MMSQAVIFSDTNLTRRCLFSVIRQERLIRHEATRDANGKSWERREHSVRPAVHLYTQELKPTSTVYYFIFYQILFSSLFPFLLRISFTFLSSPFAFLFTSSSSSTVPFSFPSTFSFTSIPHFGLCTLPFYRFSLSTGCPVIFSGNLVCFVNVFVSAPEYKVHLVYPCLYLPCTSIYLVLTLIRNSLWTEFGCRGKKSLNYFRPELFPSGKFRLSTGKSTV